jgi:hypothetical protein
MYSYLLRKSVPLFQPIPIGSWERRLFSKVSFAILPEFRGFNFSSLIRSSAWSLTSMIGARADLGGLKSAEGEIKTNKYSISKHK